MNEKYMIVLFFAMIIIGIVIYITTSNKKKKKKDSGDGKPATPTFEVVDVKLTKTESYKPWFTEMYEPGDFIAMSVGTSFKYSMKITGGAEVLTALSITRKRADEGDDQTVDVSSDNWENGTDIELTFESLDGENVKGTHEFSINYTTPEKSGSGINTVQVTVSESDLSVALEQSGGELNLDLQSVGMDTPSAEATTNKKFVFIYDIDGKLNFGKGAEIYMSPFGIDGNAFKLEGTGITDPLYRIRHKEGANGANLYLLSKSSDLNYNTTEYLDKNATVKTYKDGPLQDKLFYITMEQTTPEEAKNFFFDVDFSIPTGKWLSCGDEGERDCCDETFVGKWEQVFEEREGEVGNKCVQDEEGVWKFKFNRTGIDGCDESNEKFEYNNACCADYFLGQWTPGSCENGKRKRTRPGNEGCQSTNEDQIYDVTCPQVGEQTFTTPGTSNWVAPPGVTSVSVVCVGGGGASGKGRNVFGAGGAGGGLAYKNNITVVPGTSYPVTVGAGGAGFGGEGPYPADAGSLSASNGGNSEVFGTVAGGGQHGGGSGPDPRDGSNQPVGGAPSGTYDGGGTGGTCEGGYSHWHDPGQGPYPTWTGSGGGGAGGYSGTGGKGAGSLDNGSAGKGRLTNATAGSGGGGGGGGSRLFLMHKATYGGAGGGGVGLNGEGSNGRAGLHDSTTSGTSQVAANVAGGGGSGGGDGNLGGGSTKHAPGGTGGLYGGGAGSSHGVRETGNGGDGGNGAVRIIWGSGRSFPSNAA
jgi:ABC-type cobalt transport system substrate-binding protein